MNFTNSRNRNKRIKSRESWQDDADYQTDYSRLINLYEFFSRFPVTSKDTHQLHDLIADVGIYTSVEQRVETARLLLTSYVLLIASATIIFTLTDGVILHVGSVVLALVFRRDFIHKKLRRERLAFWKDLYRSLASLKNEYERYGSVQKAFNKAVIEDKAKLIIGTIESLFRSENPQAALAYFCQNNSYNILQRLAHLCYMSFHHGTTISPTTGIDTFVSNLDTIMGNLQIDIDDAIKERKKFYSVEKLPLVAVAIIIVLPTFLLNRYPGLTYFYNSAWGYLAIAVSMASIIVAYYVATVLNDRDRPVDDTLAFESRWFLNQRFKKFWENRVPNYNVPTENLLRSSLSYLTPAQYKFRQAYLSILFGVIVFISTVAFSILYSSSSVVDLGSLPAETLSKIQEQYESTDTFAEKYVLNANIKSLEDMSRELSGEKFNMDTVTIQLVSSILMTNREKYVNAKYSPYYLIPVGVAIIFGYLLPYILLKRREKLVQVEVKNEILVLYALVIQMMYTPLKLRDYLKQFMYVSRLYPKTHLDCYINQFNNPAFIKEVALKMDNPQYYDFMEKLYTLRSDKVPTELFREIERRREYLFNKVIEVREERFKTNYSILTILLWASLIIPLTLEVIIPLAQFSYTSISQYRELVPEK